MSAKRRQPYGFGYEASELEVLDWNIVPHTFPFRQEATFFLLEDRKIRKIFLESEWGGAYTGGEGDSKGAGGV
ncbi:MAG: hypothetical protein BLM47_11915 [Candidatus Reconcilbacillus cellulovorans]|uniref:Uncharacterized protein n=1 Tax=Candidatus Reconcilbacillus cellulovorans TaxID=1906605 RepID=A0A2A6DXW6_9BACL|nr:MAG: hypothetical protein BLM47_11915 [Candidatus Reconcilbacillus cellulovorans]